MTPSATPISASRGSIVKAVTIAFLAAVLILVAVIVPAEYGIDPLGSGRALGLTRLAEAASAPEIGPRGVLLPQTETYQSDEVQFTLQPKQTVEYKYRLDKDAGMVFTWTSTAPVMFDFHTEPEGTASSASQSFLKGEASVGRGSYVAPYNGIHGWYWENAGVAPVTIRLQSSGFYYAATEFLMDGSRKAHELIQVK